MITQWPVANMRRKSRRQNWPGRVLGIVALALGMLALEGSAFYALEDVNIAQSELQSSTACDIVTTTELIAYNCADYFKVFRTTGSLE